MTVHRVVSARLASLIELQTVYGVEDLYNLMEVAALDAHNEREAAKPRK